MTEPKFMTPAHRRAYLTHLKRCFLNNSRRSACVGTVTFSFSGVFGAVAVLLCTARVFRFSCSARNLR